MKYGRLLAVCLLAAVAATAAGLWHFGEAKPERAVTPASAGTLSVSNGRYDFSLVDARGATVSKASLAGRWHIVYFGFAGCGSTCPLALQRLSGALDDMGAEADDVRVVFISINPLDTPQKLSGFLGPFGPRFSGLTGNQEQIDAATKAFRTYAEQAPAGTDPANAYLHSSIFYVIDPDGRFRRQIPAETKSVDLALSLSQILRTKL